MLSKKDFKKWKKKFEEANTLKVSAITFAVLALFVLVFEQPGSDLSKAEKGAKYFFPKLVVEDVLRAEIDPPGAEDINVFIREDSGWVLENDLRFPVDPEKIDRFFDTLFELKEEATVSKNPEKQTGYGVTEENATRIRMWDHMNREVVSLLIGKTAGLSSHYVRHADSNEVVQVDANIESVINYSTEQWKSKHPLTLTVEDLRRIDISSPKEQYLVQPQRESWMLIEPEERTISESSVSEIVEAINAFEASNLIRPEEKVSFDEPLYKISVRQLDDSIQLVAIVQQGNDFVATNGEQEVIYVLDKKALEELFELIDETLS